MDYLGYVRVSTKKQTQSGLGEAAQLSSLAEFVNREPGARLVATYRELEASGSRSDRPELRKCLGHAKRLRGSVVLIAKLDRLTRSCAFLSTLLEAGCEVRACDCPHASKTMLQMLSVMAEFERDQCRARTTAALKAARSRGVLLGSHRPDHWKGKESLRLNGLAKAREASRRRKAKDGLEVYGEVRPLAGSMRSTGMSFKAIAERLNELGHYTPNGKQWYGTQVIRLFSEANKPNLTFGVMAPHYDSDSARVVSGA